MKAWVYILRCADSSYYVGSARGSLERRIAQHHSGAFGGYTSKRRPIELVWSADFQSIIDAIILERQIKGWSRVKKEALIRGEHVMLPLLASRSRAARRFRSFETRSFDQFRSAPQDEEGLKARLTGAPEDADGTQP